MENSQYLKILISKILFFTLVVFIHYSCDVNNKANVSNQDYSITITDSTINEIIKEVQHEIHDSAIVMMTIRSANHFPYIFENDWFVLYFYAFHPLTDKTVFLEDSTPSFFTEIDGNLFLIYTDTELYFKASKNYLNALEKKLDERLVIVEVDTLSVPMTGGDPVMVYRYERCAGKIEKTSSIHPIWSDTKGCLDEEDSSVRRSM